MSSPADPPLSHIRIPALDGLRGAAVLAVLFCHLAYFFPIDNVFKIIMGAGWCGVDLFFVLSGFLITGILLDTRLAANYFRAFYIRRVLRIFPVYYASLTTILLASHFFPKMNALLPVPHDRIFYFFYLNNWWILLQDHWRANIIGHFWSLAVEEQFYLVWPLIVWVLVRKQIELVALCGIVLAPIIRVALYAHYGDIRDLVENPFCRMDSLLMGAFLAGHVRGKHSAGKWQIYLSISVGIAIIAGGFSDFLMLKVIHSPLFIGTGLAIVFGGLILTAFQERDSAPLLQRILRNPVLTSCGKISYGMYVFHVPLLWLLAQKPVADLPQFCLLTLAEFSLTIALAKLSLDHFETRFLRPKAKSAAGSPP